MPDFDRHVREIIREITENVAQHILPEDPLLADVIARHLRYVWEEENVATEAIASVQGDQYAKRGDNERAEAAWAVAARIRMRRPLHPFSEGT